MISLMGLTVSEILESVKMRRLKLLWLILTMKTGGVNELYASIHEMHHYWRLDDKWRTDSLYRKVHTCSQQHLIDINQEERDSLYE